MNGRLKKLQSETSKLMDANSSILKEKLLSPKQHPTSLYSDDQSEGSGAHQSLGSTGVDFK